MSAPFCKHCTTLNEIPGKPTGSQQDIAGVGCYVKDGTQKGTIIICTDIFGLGIDNPKITADQMASESGYRVIVPDLFLGDPIKPSDFFLPKHSAEGPPSQDVQDKNMAAMGEWVGRDHSPDHTFPLLQKVFDEVFKDGPVGIAGYCYGGRLAATAAIQGLAPVAIHHPAMLSPEEAGQVKSKVLLNMSELDPMFSGEVKDTWVKTLKENGKLDERSQTFPGTVHGHGSRPDLSQPDTEAAYKTSLSNAVAFFKDNFKA